MSDNSTTADKPRIRSIKLKITGAIALFLLAIMLADTAYTIHMQQEQSENEALEKAQVLATEMRATWDFVDLNQESLNRNDDGTFRTKNLVCVVTAKAVSQLFTDNSDYTIGFVREDPRQVSATPDEFEQAALDAFESDDSVTSYYGVETDENGEQVFRYVEPLYITESCLECHGDPAGELDQFGYVKEGLQEGDIAGAMSITEPMSIYEDSRDSMILRQVLLTFVALLLASVVIYFIVSRTVLRRLEKLQKAVQQIDSGDFNYELVARDWKDPSFDEIDEVFQDFNKMASELETLYKDLEGQVEKKTYEMGVLNEMLLYQQAELKSYIDRLSEETQYKNSFFAITSHELRTPLTSILGYARILRQDETLSEKTQEQIREIEQNASILLDMVNNILVLSRAEAHKNQLVSEPIDFVDLLGTVRNSLKPLAEDKEISLSAKADEDVPLAMGDWEKLRRIVENLTSNAIKYTHRQGNVSIEAHFEAPENSEYENGAIVLQVTDDGIGIREEDITTIFDLYQQAGTQSANRRFKGTGLGLAVVKELTTLHGGDVSVQSVHKEGSTFTVHIPYIAVDEEEYDE